MYKGCGVFHMNMPGELLPSSLHVFPATQMSFISFFNLLDVASCSNCCSFFSSSHVPLCAAQRMLTYNQSCSSSPRFASRPSAELTSQLRRGRWDREAKCQRRGESEASPSFSHVLLDWVCLAPLGWILPLTKQRILRSIFSHNVLIVDIGSPRPSPSATKNICLIFHMSGSAFRT